MFTGGNITLYVADIDRSIDFYTKALGFKLRMRSGDVWAEVVLDETLVIGLHKANETTPSPGSADGFKIGLNLRVSLKDAMEKLNAQGIRFDGKVEGDGPISLAYFTDPDGTPLYICKYIAVPTE